MRPSGKDHVMSILQNGLFLHLVVRYKLEFLGREYLLMLFGSYLLCLLVGYLLGSVNSAVIASRFLFRDDIRRHGSGNAGLTNMYRVYGKKGALPTLLGDVLKTVLSVLFGAALMGFGYFGGFALGGDGLLSFGVYLSAIGCVLGHILPIYNRFKGGKGVLCSFTATALLCPPVALILLLIFIFIVAVTKYISLGSVAAAALFPIFLNPVFGALVHSVVTDGEQTVEGSAAIPIYMLIYSFLIALIVICCHRANIKRLWNHEESKFSFHKKSDLTGASAKEGDEVENG